jgi:mannose-6-phosphate isomerase-like protein (cupin superfamily)
MSEISSHDSGIKRVFLNENSTQSSLMQFAYGIFAPDEGCEKHKHETMIECFFFIKGRGVFQIGNEIFNIGPTSFVKVPGDTDHFLKSDAEEELHFVYFGIAIN